MSISPPILGYRKPYPAHYDVLPFPKGYPKPTFDKFDGLNGSPHEHLAHFSSACGETSQLDALLIRQLVQSLKGSALTWYTQLPPGSILTWDDMQKVFLAQFVSSKKKVSLIDLAKTTQKLGESANDFIMRWRSLNLECTEKITEQSAVQMCYNNLLLEIATFVATAEPQSFDALVPKASNVEIQIARQKTTTKIQIGEKKSEGKKTFKKGESIATFVKTDKKNDRGKGKEETRRLTLKERKEVKYTFDDEDVETILDELLAAKAIKLPEPKCPTEVDKTNDSKYCRYHRIVSHPLRDYFVLKNMIQEKINNHEIEVDSSSKQQIATSNMIEGELISHVSLPNVPTLYDLMTAPSLDVWEDESDESQSKWQTVVKRRTKKFIKHSSVLKSTTRHGVKITSEPSLKNKKLKNKILEKPKTIQGKEYEQQPRASVTLAEFLPASLLKKNYEEKEECFACFMTSYETSEEADQTTLHTAPVIPGKLKMTEIPISLKSFAVEILVKASSSRSQEGQTCARDQSQLDVLAHLKRIPAFLNIYDAIQMSKEIREALTVALMSPEMFRTNFEPANAAICGEPCYGFGRPYVICGEP
ncbi:hypothetical protein L3X38_015294 [Prunus dulcis]|uniref:Retrotransposon gag domain-containing protein n=1 Tax=Prunus dulcis TaxID=3755 RepID=A0AAD4WPV3_PRUDU|nr:hypothetical protein L3X38_015294 [Prunus dulcis]